MLRHRRLEFVRACQGAKDRHGRPGDERGRLPDGDGVACNGGHEQTEGPKETDGQEVFAEDGHDARQSEKNTGRLDVKQLQVGEMTFQHVRSHDDEGALIPPLDLEIPQPYAQQHDDEDDRPDKSRCAPGPWCGQPARDSLAAHQERAGGDSGRDRNRAQVDDDRGMEGPVEVRSVAVGRQSIRDGSQQLIAEQ